MSMKYIRDRYGVPAKRGARIRFTDSNGVQWIGRVKSAPGHRIHVAFPEFPRGTAILHPTWNVEYLS